MISNNHYDTGTLSQSQAPSRTLPSHNHSLEGTTNNIKLAILVLSDSKSVFPIRLLGDVVLDEDRGSGVGVACRRDGGLYPFAAVYDKVANEDVCTFPDEGVGHGFAET